MTRRGPGEEEEEVEEEGGGAGGSARAWRGWEPSAEPGRWEQRGEARRARSEEGAGERRWRWGSSRSLGEEEGTMRVPDTPPAALRP
ncbi:hypothetical protein LUU34_00679600 [Aix galericulata]|nr:hypothetical protein LUU34_00679600 [Aix galericulata]